MISFPRGAALGNLVLGQILSICITASGAITQKLNETYGLDVAGLQTTVVYIVVAVLFWLALMHFSVEYFWTREFRSKIPMTIIISLFDVAASVLLLHSYQYLSVPMVALLSTLATPTVMLLSWLFLGAKYNWRSILGASIAVSGVVALIVYQPTFEFGGGTAAAGSGGMSTYVGHALCVASAVIYAISNILTEHVTKMGGSLTEFLALNSSFASVWSCIYLVFWRSHEVGKVLEAGWSPVAIYFPAYCGFMILFYSLMPTVMLRTSAAFFNLSLLTVNFLSLLVGLLVFNESFSWPFWTAFPVIMAGLLIFNWPSEVDEQSRVELS